MGTLFRCCAALFGGATPDSKHTQMKPFLLIVLLCAQAWGADWPGVKFAEVRAYYYNNAGAFSIPILKNGRLNPGIENPEGSLLSKEQADRLLQILNTKRF